MGKERPGVLRSSIELPLLAEWTGLEPVTTLFQSVNPELSAHHHEYTLLPRGMPQGAGEIPPG